MSPGHDGSSIWSARSLRRWGAQHVIDNAPIDGSGTSPSSDAPQSSRDVTRPKASSVRSGGLVTEFVDRPIDSVTRSTEPTQINGSALRPHWAACAGTRRIHRWSHGKCELLTPGVTTMH